MAPAIFSVFEHRSRRLEAMTAVASACLLVGATLLANASGASAATTAASPSGRCTAKIDQSLPTSGNDDVIVVGRAGDGRGAAAAVSAVGGRVAAHLPVVDGVRASVPAAALASLGCSPSVTSVTPNSAVRFQGRRDQQGAPASASDFVRATGALPLWRRGNDGTGIGVAVIDTGISPMNDVAGRVVNGPDLSGEGTIIDSYGHGTVMAGIIGGDGQDSEDAQAGPNTGVAPGATLISVKVAGRNGATDVSTVLQAMHWVSAYKDEFNIRVLNLSWGTPSTQSASIDPLNFAVERLWQQGIVVVAAAGNAGPAAGTILKPADDPLVITAGAYEHSTTRSGRTAYSVAAWSSAGPTADGIAKPDLVAPGKTLIAQRSYGSLVEAENPSALIAPSYLKGSGTSEAAAVTSGAIAVLLQARPQLSPDQVKNILTGIADPIARTARYRQGAGRLSLSGALDAPAGPAVTQVPIATGLGSLEASRGGRHVQVDCEEDGTLDVIAGEVDARCQPWTPESWTGGSWTGSSWTGGSWTGSSWTGSSWTGGSWTGASWTGSSWTGGSWTGGSWTGSSWTGSSWTGGSWTGSSWTGSSWTGGSWTGSSWTGNQSSGGASSDGTFLTAWWGELPSSDLHIAGEESSDADVVSDAGTAPS